MMLLRIESDRPDGGEADRNDVIAARLDLVVEVRLVLKRVGVEVAVLQRLVRLGVVVEHDELDVEPFVFACSATTAQTSSSSALEIPTRRVFCSASAPAGASHGVSANIPAKTKRRSSLMYGLQRSGSPPPSALAY